MKKILLLLCILSVSLFANIGKITALRGDVIIQRDTKQIKAKVGSTLDLKDTLITKDKSKALLLFNDKTSITVGKNSTMNMKSFVYDLQQPSKDKATFKFAKGLFRTITGQIGKINKKKFKIKVKSASIGIRGTVFDVAVSKDATKVGVVQGGIYYVDSTTMKSFDVKKGENLVYDDTTGGVKISVGNLKETKQMDKDSKEMKKDEQKALAKENKKEKKKEEKKKEDKKENKKENKKEEKKNNTKENKKEKSEAKKEDKKESEGKKQKSVAKQGDDSNDKQQTEQKGEKTALNNTPNETKAIATKELKTDTKIEDFGDVDQKALDSDVKVVVKPINNPVTTTDTTQDVPTVSIDDITNTINDTTNVIDDTINNQQTDVVEETTTTQDTVADTTTPPPTTDTTVTTTTPPPTTDPTALLPTITTDIQAITDKIMSSDDTYTDMEFGFIGIDDDSDKLPDDPSTAGLYLTGNITPNEVIENYISNGATASYSGGISALTDGLASEGTINIDVDFGTQSVTGNLNITQGNWQGTINSGSVTPYGFNSTDISGTSDHGSITNGAVDGKFYGADASNVGGRFHLSTSTKSANGVFGAKGTVTNQ